MTVQQLFEYGNKVCHDNTTYYTQSSYSAATDLCLLLQQMFYAFIATAREFPTFVKQNYNLFRDMSIIYTQDTLEVCKGFYFTHQLDIHIVIVTFLFVYSCVKMLSCLSSNAEIKRLNKKIAKMRTRNQTEISKLKNDLSQSKTDLFNSQQTHRSLSQDITNLTEINTIYEDKIKVCHTKITDLEKKLVSNQTIQEPDTIRAQLSLAKKEIKTLKSKLAKSVKDIDQQTSDYVDAYNLIAEIRDICEIDKRPAYKVSRIRTLLMQALENEDGADAEQ